MQTLIPLIACGISILYLSIDTIQRTVKLRQRKGYKPLSGTVSPPGIPKDAIEDEEETEGVDYLGGGAADNTSLSLHKSASAIGDSVAEIRPPRGAVVVVVEVLAVLSQVGLHLEGLLAGTQGQKGRIASISGLCVWGYILLLTLSRLVLPRLRRKPLPQLWNHTAALYGLQWLCTVIIFRTAIIHPRSRFSQAMVITEFSLVSLLAIIAVTTRKGNRPVLLKYEKNIEPSHEPLASLLSLATFGWVDAIVWRGYWKTLELADVWNILPTDEAAHVVLMALLGEMTLLSGRVRLPGGSREKLQVDLATGLTESVAYCAQQAWLVNDTIKQNILFASPYDDSRYNSVIEACALKRDLEVLEAGDATLVGEKGIVVSGGQKQRISLARALYCNAKYILLDDCLSAVDSHTAQHIFEHCILGPQMLNRTCILVTHSVALCLSRSQYVVVLANGKIAAQGTPEKVMASGAVGGELLSSRPTSKGGTRPPSRARSLLDAAGEASPEVNNGHPSGKASGQANGSHGDAHSKQKPQEEVEDANIRTEGKAEGAVDWHVIKLYLASMGPGYFWVLIILANAMENIAQVSTNLWIRSWANSYSTEAVSTMQSLQHPIFQRSSGGTGASSFTWIGGPIIPFFSTPVRGFSLVSTRTEVDIGYYIALLAAIYILVSLSKLGILFKGSLNASRVLHSKLLEAVLRAKFKFFDTTPLGQIMNRFSKDLQQIDQEVALVAGGVLQGILNLIAIITLISVITPGFLIAAFFLSCLYFCIGMFYVRSSRDLKRIESVQRAPLYQQFGETLSGITTIRAYGDEHRFIRDNFQRINTHNRPFIYM